jgi:hypothetical protein
MHVGPQIALRSGLTALSSLKMHPSLTVMIMMTDEAGSAGESFSWFLSLGRRQLAPPPALQPSGNQDEHLGCGLAPALHHPGRGLIVRVANSPWKPSGVCWMLVLVGSSAEGSSKPNAGSFQFRALRNEIVKASTASESYCLLEPGLKLNSMV